MLALLNDGTWFGEGSVVGIQSRVLEVWAETDVQAVLLPASAVKALAEDYPIIYKNLFEHHMERTQVVYELLAGMMFYPLKARLAGRILFMLEDYGEPPPDGVELDVKMSQIDFAQMSMGSRQRVNKAFREWVSEGVIEKQGDKYIIKDVSALQDAVSLDSDA